ncbi:unnamed protein product [Moneuplotes crassus]|uniref:Uncharacterized protein n=1 Tax=Euplotes crassus TaxID=5936 RepID=A0AAD1XB27_EUPCR|nr:unnamed protein product [Moneuplotes crassus]
MKLGKKLIIFKPKASKTRQAVSDLKINTSNDENKCDRNCNNLPLSSGHSRNSKIIFMKKKTHLESGHLRIEKIFGNNYQTPKITKNKSQSLIGNTTSNPQEPGSPQSLTAKYKKFRPGRLLRRNTKSFQTIPKVFLSPTMETIQEYPQESLDNIKPPKLSISRDIEAGVFTPNRTLKNCAKGSNKYTRGNILCTSQSTQKLEIRSPKMLKGSSSVLSSPHLRFRENKKMEILSKYCNTECETETDSTKESDIKSPYINMHSNERKLKVLPKPKKIPSAKALTIMMNNTIKDVVKYKKRVFKKNKTIPIESCQSLPRLPKLR